MAMMDEGSVHAVVTSPPYYGLREYGNSVWEGGDDPECDHKVVNEHQKQGETSLRAGRSNTDEQRSDNHGKNVCPKCGATRIEPTVWGGDAEHEHVFGLEVPPVSRGGSGTPTDKNNRGEGYGATSPRGNFCDCGAWRGALGLEPTPDLYVEHMVEVFRGVWRVMRDDGVAWLNLGDTYARVQDTNVPQTKNKAVPYPEVSNFSLVSKQGSSDGAVGRADRPGSRAKAYGLKAKDLIGIPWRVAFALQADGWYLRQDIVWSKPNAMPESVEDRPTRSHEFIFMLTKKPRYFFDHIAIKEPVGEAMKQAAKRKAIEPGRTYQHDADNRMGKTSPNRVWSDPEAVARILAGRNKRDVWEVNTIPYPGAHYAVFPPKLVEPMVKASTSEGGCCPDCGAPFNRKTVDRGVTTAKGGRPHDPEYGRKMADDMDALNGDGMVGDGFPIIEKETVGWEPSCAHVSPRSARPCVVFDPFGGSGTVGMVAQSLGRRAVLVDLNPEYLEQQLVRNSQTPLGI